MFLGNWASAKSHEVVKHLGITHIVNATEGCGTPFEGEVRYIKCPLDDAPGANIEQYFGPCVEFIREAKDNGGRVLVHCQMGMSRSSALILLWLMHHRGMSLRDAMMYTRERRPYINPNPGFLQQLGKHEVRALVVFMRRCIYIYIYIYQYSASEELAGRSGRDSNQQW